MLEAFTEREIPFVVVEANRDEALLLQEKGRNVLHGDPEATDTLARAWIDDASAVVIVGDDRPVLNVALAEVTGRLLALNVVEGVVARTGAGTAVVRMAAEAVDAETIGDLGLGDGCVLAGVERAGRLETDLDDGDALREGDALVLVGDGRALRRWRGR